MYTVFDNQIRFRNGDTVLIWRVRDYFVLRVNLVIKTFRPFRPISPIFWYQNNLEHFEFKHILFDKCLDIRPLIFWDIWEMKDRPFISSSGLLTSFQCMHINYINHCAYSLLCLKKIVFEIKRSKFWTSSSWKSLVNTWENDYIVLVNNCKIHILLL